MLPITIMDWMTAKTLNLVLIFLGLGKKNTLQYSLALKFFLNLGQESIFQDTGLKQN